MITLLLAIRNPETAVRDGKVCSIVGAKKDGEAVGSLKIQEVWENEAESLVNFLKELTGEDVEVDYLS